MKALRLALLTAVLSALLVPAAQAAPVGGLKQYKVPTANSEPGAITLGSDGNMWFTEGTSFTLAPPKLGRVTPAGTVTEFPIQCSDCILSDVVQGPSNILYFTSNDAELGRFNVATGTQLLPSIEMPDIDVLAGKLAVHGDDVWITDFINNSVWRYDIPTGVFTQFAPPTPGSSPNYVAVDNAGTVWFTEVGAGQIARLNPQTGAITEFPATSFPQGIAVATDGQVWFAQRVTPQAVLRFNPATNVLTPFSVTNAGPQSIVAAPDGSMWFTQNTKGNIARITNGGAITEGKVVKGSEPFDITLDAGGDPWYTMTAADKIAEFQLR
jgi:virginiamycin B lyase